MARRISGERTGAARCVVLLASALALAACGKPSTAGADAGAVAEVVADAAPRAASRAIPRADAGPTVDVGLAVVARGGAAGASSSPALALRPLGGRVWLASKGLDAFAVAGGPLARGPSPVTKIPVAPDSHRLDVVGTWPNLFAVRARVLTRMLGPEATLFVGNADGAGNVAWSPPRDLRHESSPTAVVAYRGGVLLVRPGATNPLGVVDQGSTLELFAGSGASLPPPAIPKDFFVWDASSDAGHVALLGHGPRRPDGGAPALVVVHVDRAGEARTLQVPASFETRARLDPTHASVLQRGGATLLFAASERASVGLAKGGSLVVGVFAESAAFTSRVVPGPDDCRVASADVEGDVVWAVRECPEASADALVRVGRDGRADVIALPGDCHPRRVLVHAEDLWVTAECGEALAVLRRGKPQDPVVLP